MAKRKTVAGLKLIRHVDETMRKRIENAGPDLEARAKKAYSLGLLDEKHYKRIYQVIRCIGPIWFPLFYYYSFKWAVVMLTFLN